MTISRPASSHALQTLLVGDVARAEFAAALPALQRWGHVESHRDIDAAVEALANGACVPAVIVVAEAFPGQISQDAIDRLRRLAPLTPIVGLLGSWCEGETRTGSPWPGVVRVYWHGWPARCDRELRRLAEGRPGSWTLPPTATDEERLLADMSHDTRKCQGLLVIHSHSAEMAGCLAAACQSRGLATIWLRDTAAMRVQGAVAAIFDGTDLSPREEERLARLSVAIRPAPVTALLAFPRIEDHHRALTAGAVAVISKPLVWDDLFDRLAELHGATSDCVRE